MTIQHRQTYEAFCFVDRPHINIKKNSISWPLLLFKLPATPAQGHLDLSPWTCDLTVPQSTVIYKKNCSQF